VWVFTCVYVPRSVGNERQARIVLVLRTTVTVINLGQSAVVVRHMHSASFLQIQVQCNTQCVIDKIALVHTYTEHLHKRP